MTRFKVIVAGTWKNGGPDGCSGFATTRFVRSKSERAASEEALTIVAMAVATEPLFVGAPEPALEVDTIERVRNPFKLSRPQGGYSLVGTDASLEDVLRLERKVAKGWLL